MLTSKATDLANTSYGGKPLEIAGFSPDQMKAFENVRNLDPTVSTERVVDEGGRLGAISDYLNPYTGQALQPALRAIDEAQAANAKKIGASATSAGAFGDARHGILEAQNQRNAQLARGETAAKFYKDAFDTAMQQRGQDLSRFTEADKTNFGQALQAASALLSTGGQQQGLEQAKNQAVLDDFLRKYGHDFSVLEALGAALSGTPYTRTTTAEQPSNSISQLLGSGIGAFFAAGGA